MRKLSKFMIVVAFTIFSVALFSACNNRIDPIETQASFSGFTKINDSTYSIIVSNVTEILNISDVVKANAQSSWELTTDIQANNIIPSKIATLVAGDNTYYVLISDKKENVKLYTLKIRRRPLYSVSLNIAGDYIEPSQTIEEGFLAKMPTNPSRTGYTFVDWSFNFETVITSDTNVTANWQANTYQIIYHANNGIDDKINQNAEFGSVVKLFTNSTFEKTAYDLVRWNTKADGSGTNYYCGQNISSYRIDGDLELFAIFLPTQYSIAYNLDGGMNGNNPSFYNVETDNIELADARKRGRFFDGWYTESGFVNEVSTIPSGSLGNKNLWAKFSIIDYDITYHLDNGMNGDNPEKYTVVSNEIIFNEASKTGYLFDGWYAESDFINRVTSIQMNSVGNIKLYAKFTIISYTISYFLDSGTNGENPLVYNIEDDTIDLNDASKTDYTFFGWYAESTFENRIEFISRGSHNDLVIYARFEFLGGGHGTRQSPYAVTNRNQLYRFAELVNSGNGYENLYFQLTQNISLSYEEWIPIGVENSFKGYFNGNGYEVRDFKITKYQKNAGFFGIIQGGIDALGVANFTIDFGVPNVTTGFPSSNAGGIAGVNLGGVINCSYAKVNIKVVDVYLPPYVGGLVGWSQSGSIISDCYSLGTVKAMGNIGAVAGGLIGEIIGSNNTISNSFSCCSVLASSSFYDSCSGGLIGKISGSNNKINNCYAASGNVKVKGESIYIGGLIGRMEDFAIIDNCFRYFNDELGNSIGAVCNISQLNSKEFYNSVLKWSDAIWAVNDVDYESNHYPELLRFTR